MGKTVWPAYGPYLNVKVAFLILFNKMAVLTMPRTATMASPHRVTLEDRSLDSTSLRNKEMMRVTFPVDSAEEPG